MADESNIEKSQRLQIEALKKELDGSRARVDAMREECNARIQDWSRQVYEVLHQPEERGWGLFNIGEILQRIAALKARHDVDGMEKLLEAQRVRHEAEIMKLKAGISETITAVQQSAAKESTAALDKSRDLFVAVARERDECMHRLHAFSRELAALLNWPDDTTPPTTEQLVEGVEQLQRTVEGYRDAEDSGVVGIAAQLLAAMISSGTLDGHSSKENAIADAVRSARLLISETHKEDT